MATTYSVGDQPIPGAGYCLAAFLGRGGFGEVWKATAPGGAEAAIKIIRLGSREGRKELRALQLVKRIHHTNLVPIIAFWIKNDRGEILDVEAVLKADRRETVPRVTAAAPTIPLPVAAAEGPAELVIAMGLGDQNLYDRLEQCRQEGLPGIPDEELLGYLEDGAAAIDFLNSPIHDLGSGPAAIQHCDIKPQNMVLVGGAVQVCDFGLARMMGGDRATTAAASVAYAAPECLVDGKPSASTDQYCLAVSFVELKSGQLPYSDLTMAAVIDAKRNDQLDFSMLPAAVRPVVRRATNSDPAKRYGSCREMVGELRRALSQADAVPRPPSKAGRLFVAVAILVAAAGGGVWAWHNYMPKIEPPQASNIPIAKPAELVDSGQTKMGSTTKPLDSSITKPVDVSLTKPQDTAVSKSPANVAPKESPGQEGERLLASGFEALKQKNFAAAVADLQRASRLLPRDPRVFSRLGAACSAERKWNDAIASYTTAIELEPFDKDYISRGLAFKATEQDDKALADFAAAVRLNPGNALACIHLGNAYLDKDNPDRAVAAFSEAVGICTRDPSANFPLLDARVARANAYILQGKKAEAANDLTLALPRLRDDSQSTQSVVDAIDDLAKSYAEASQFAEAVKWAKRSVELLPNEKAREMLKKYQESR